MDCLKPASAPSSTILEEPPEHLGKDEGDFVAHDIIAGPFKVSYLEGRKWLMPEYPLLYKFFMLTEKENRSVLYNKKFRYCEEKNQAFLRSESSIYSSPVTLPYKTIIK